MDFTFKEFISGSFDYSPESRTHTSLYLNPTGEPTGLIRREDIDRLRDYPEETVVTISGLRQDTFEYFIKTYGKQLRAVRFFKNRLVSDWSLLGTLPDLEYIDFYMNHRIEKLWDMRGNTALTGLSIMDFSRLHDLDGVAEAPALKYLRVGNATHGRMILRSLLPLKDSRLEEVSFSGKDILDKDLSFLASMPALRVFDFPARLYSTEEVAFIAANYPEVTGYSIRPYIDLTERILNGEPGHIVVGRHKPFLRLGGYEKRLQNYAQAFEDMKERYKGVDCRAAFSGKQKRRTKRKLKTHGKAGARKQKKTGKRRFPRIGKTKK